MGKKSKNPRKAQAKQESDPRLRAVDKVLANAPPRVDMNPPSIKCPHMMDEVVQLENLEELQKEVKELQGGRLLGINGEDKASLHVWAILSRGEYANYHKMKDLAVATAVDYLLRYDCSSKYSKIYGLVGDLVCVASVFHEVDEGYGIMEDGRDYAPIGKKIPDLLDQGLQKGYVLAETELSMVNYMNKMAPCRCLKKLKRKLIEKYGPQFDTCQNKHCQTLRQTDEFLECQGCLRRYCTKECQMADWEDGKHGGRCKNRDGKRNYERLNKICAINPHLSPSHFHDWGDEEMAQLRNVLDRMSLEEAIKIGRGKGNATEAPAKTEDGEEP